MRRVLVLLTVVGLLVVMVVMTVTSAFARGAQPYGGGCEAGSVNG
jgi:hypothetical protein